VYLEELHHKYEQLGGEIRSLKLIFSFINGHTFWERLNMK